MADPSKTVTIDTAKVEGLLQVADEQMKKSSETMGDILTLLDTLPLSERKRIARAVAVYFEVYR